MNNQPIEKRVDSASTLSVHSIFYTIQGEGPFCGTPCVFVRLAGCNLQCPGCDTDYTSGRRDSNALEITDLVSQEFANHRFSPGAREPLLVVITGGEPFRQPIGPLLNHLVRSGFFVQIETNGTLPPPKNVSFNQNITSRHGIYLVVSPKTGRVNPQTAAEAFCYKYVMGAGSVDKHDGLPIKVLDNGTAEMKVARAPRTRLIYLQPEDSYDAEKNKANVKACIESCFLHGYIFQLQVHKLIGLP